MRVNHTQQLLFIIAGVLAIVILPGCASVESEINLYRNGRWDGSLNLVIDRDSMESFGQDEEELEASMIEEFGPVGRKHEEEGVTYSWKKGRSDADSIVYHINMSGKDFESLEAVGATATIAAGPNGRDVIYFRMTQNEFRNVGKFSLILKADDILDSNADRVSGGTAEWDDLSYYQAAEATVAGIRKLSFGWIVLLVLGGLGLLFVLGTVVLSKDQGSRRNIRSAQSFCTVCGEQLQPGAHFCMKCGTQVTNNKTDGGS